MESKNQPSSQLSESESYAHVVKIWKEFLLTTSASFAFFGISVIDLLASRQPDALSVLALPPAVLCIVIAKGKLKYLINLLEWEQKQLSKK